MRDGFIPAHGGYVKLASYQKALIVYDATVAFCERFLNRRDRTYDQMVQAARSGKQNIVEGSMASGTSKEMEIKLTNVARASLEELLEDYRDFLRTRNAVLWDKNSPQALYVRRLASGQASCSKASSHMSHSSHASHSQNRAVTFESFRGFFETRPSETLANITICLIHQANYLLDRQLERLERAFLRDGGLRERMTKARLTSRKSGASKH